MSLEERYSKKSNSIFLFGGAFDPIHNGHIQIAKEIFRKFMPLEFFFIPSNNPPHKNIITPYKNRVEMLELALNKQSPFKISYIENNKKKNNFAIDYVLYFKRLYPKKKINLVLGFDSFLYCPVAGGHHDSTHGGGAEFFQQGFNAQVKQTQSLAGVEKNVFRPVVDGGTEIHRQVCPGGHGGHPDPGVQSGTLYDTGVSATQ